MVNHIAVYIGFCYYEKQLKITQLSHLSSFPLLIFLPNISVRISHSVMSNSLRPHESQHARPPCPSPTPRVHSNPRPSSRWCHLAIYSSVVPFSSCLQSFPASGSFQMSQFFASGHQSIRISASASVSIFKIFKISSAGCLFFFFPPRWHTTAWLWQKADLSVLRKFSPLWA